MRILLLISVFLSSSLIAQIPNPGFETWIIGNWLPVPEGWATPTDQLESVVTQDTDAYDGDFAMRVDAVNNGLGAYGWAECTVPIDYIPASLDFYAKAGTEFGGVSVTISFYNNEFLFNSFEWNSSTSIDEWTLVSIPLVQNEPVLTHAIIRIEAFVGDLVPGVAWISVDAMGFDGPLSNNDQIVDDQIRLFPNPANDYITLSGLRGGSNVRIINLAGKTVFESNATKPQMIADVKNLPKGLYILYIQYSDEFSASRKLVIR